MTTGLVAELPNIDLKDLDDTGAERSLAGTCDDLAELTGERQCVEA
jgi:hypothetical protein